MSKAISMSGGGLSDARPGIPFDTAQLANKKMMDYFGKTTLDDMRALSFEELHPDVTEYTDATKKRIIWSPVIDDYLLKDTFTMMQHLPKKFQTFPICSGLLPMIWMI